MTISYCKGSWEVHFSVSDLEKERVELGDGACHLCHFPARVPCFLHAFFFNKVNEAGEFIEKVK
jgi:hypothetical protein